MSWRDEVPENTAQTVTFQDKFLKIPDPQIGRTSEVRLRVLDDEPLSIWRHWAGGRPYNCPGLDRCPVCKVRMNAKKNNPDGYKDEYQMDFRYFFNVLSEGEVKAWSFTNSVGRKLKVFIEKYGDLRDYDISVTKRKTGNLAKNVEYDVIFEGKSILTAEDLATAEDKQDLSQYVIPADFAVLEQIALGQEPTREDNASIVKATKADMIMLKALLAKNKFELSHFGLDESNPPSKDTIEKLIDELKVEKH